jgi:hypothetical protein
MYWSYFDFHLLLISCPVPAGVVSLCRNTLVNAGPLPACGSLALMTWELAAIPCSHVFIPMFAGWLSTRARKLRNIILCRKLPALVWQDAANVDGKMHRWGMMTYGERRTAPPFSDEEWEQRNMRRNCRLLRSPSLSAAWSALRLHCIVVRCVRWFCVCDLMTFEESTNIVLLMWRISNTCSIVSIAFAAKK